MNNGVKAIITLIVAGILSFVCFWMFIIFAFGGEDAYMTLLVIAYFVLLLLIPMSVFRVFTPKTRRILWLAVVGAIVVTVTVRESVRAYHNSFEKFDEVRVDLNNYKPFGEGTLAVKTDFPASLKLIDSLPRLDGATALYPIYAAFAQAVYPEKDYPLYDSEVMCHTTADAYNALIRDEADIIFVLQPSEEQLAYAHQMEVGMVLTPIGREAFVFFVNADNPVTGLTQGQLRNIYSGRTTNWKDVGGSNRIIRAFQREAGSGSQTAFLKFMEDSDIMIPPQRDVVHGMGGIIERTASYANYPGAIGYTFRFYSESMVGNDDIKLLSVDGIFPDTETIRRGEYPLTGDFYAVTRSDETNPNVALLIDWILSDQGQYIIEKTGYNPIR